jgi:hypothetical protein
VFLVSSLDCSVLIELLWVLFDNFCSTMETTGGMAAAGGRSNSSSHKDTGGSSRFDFSFCLILLS